jgi:hypothetical protein
MRRVARIAGASLLAAVVAGSTAPFVRADVKDDCMASAEQSQPLRRDGKLIASRQKLLACARAECPAFVRNDCTKWLGEVEAAMPSIIVRAVDAANGDIADVSVSVDGTQVATTLDGREVPIDPGAHTIRYEHAGAAPVEDRVLIRETERARVLSVKFDVGAASRAARGESSGGGAAEKPASAGPPLLPLLLIGAGAAAVGVGAYFWISGLNDRSYLQSTCAGAHTCTPAATAASKDKLQVGDVVAGVGVVAAAVGVWLYLRARGASSQPAPPPVDVHTVSGGAVLDVRGRF